MPVEQRVLSRPIPDACQEECDQRDADRASCLKQLQAHAQEQRSAILEPLCEVARDPPVDEKLEERRAYHAQDDAGLDGDGGQDPQARCRCEQPKTP